MVCGVENGGKDITYKLRNQSFLIFSLGAILPKCHTMHISEYLLCVRYYPSHSGKSLKKCSIGAYILAKKDRELSKQMDWENEYC